MKDLRCGVRDAEAVVGVRGYLRLKEWLCVKMGMTGMQSIRER